MLSRPSWKIVFLILLLTAAAFSAIVGFIFIRTQYIYYRISQDSPSDSLRADVQSKSARLLAWISTPSTCLGLVSSLIFGHLSDTIGRCMTLGFNLLGLAVMASSISCIILFQLPLSLFIVESFATALLGGSIISLAFQAGVILTDVNNAHAGCSCSHDNMGIAPIDESTPILTESRSSDERDRNRRRLWLLTLLDVCIALSSAASVSLSGILIDRFGFDISVIVYLAFFSVSLIGLFALPETLPGTQLRLTSTGPTQSTLLIRLVKTHLIELWSILLGGSKTTLVGLFILFIYSITTFNESQYTSYYLMRAPFCWSPEAVGLYLGLFGLSLALSSLTLTSILSCTMPSASPPLSVTVTDTGNDSPPNPPGPIDRSSLVPRHDERGMVQLMLLRSQLHSITYLMIGQLSVIGHNLVMAFAWQLHQPYANVALFVAPSIALLRSATTTTLKSLLSSMQDSAKQGRLFSLFGFVEHLGVLVGLPAMPALYAATVDSSFPGAVYLFIASLASLSLVLIIFTCPSSYSTVLCQKNGTSKLVLHHQYLPTKPIVEISPLFKPRCSKVSRLSTEPVICGGPQRQAISPCQNGWRMERLIVREPHQCQCRPHHFERKVECSDQDASDKCGANQDFVDQLMPCPETCESSLLGRPANCTNSSPEVRRPSAGGGCQCKRGYVLDGLLCVRPSQCGCLSSICIDRVPIDRCKQWQSQGYCKSKVKFMQNVCRATCRHCFQPCDDLISRSQCVKVKKLGQCEDDFYKVACRLTCHPEQCACPECKQVSGPCNPSTQTMELRKTCYRRTPNGKCTPEVTRTFQPCGACPKQLLRRAGRCNYCKGYRTIQLESYVRQQVGSRQCRPLSVDQREPCDCKPLNLVRSRCSTDHKTLVHVVRRRIQTSCFDCIFKTTYHKKPPVVCSGKWIVKRGPCLLDSSTKTQRRSIQIVKRVAKDCRCVAITRQSSEVCGDCPAAIKSSPVCVPNKHQLAVKVTSYVKQAGQCKPTYSMEWLPQLTCPPPLVATTSSNAGGGRFVCNPATCERQWHSTSWHWDECKCRQVELKHAAGKCCCPKTKTTVSPCRKRFNVETQVSFTLIEGRCARVVRRRRLQCACPPTRHHYRCDAKTQRKLIKTTSFEYHPDEGWCKQTLAMEAHPTRCAEEGIKRVGACRITDNSKPGRLYRQLLIVIPIVEQCRCLEPKTRLVLEACRCPEASLEPVVRQLSTCPADCSPSRSDKHCDSSRCQAVSIWQQLVYVDGGKDEVLPTGNQTLGGLDDHCKVKTIRRIVKPCCCNLNREVQHSCAASGTHFIERIKETRMIEGACVRILRVIRRPIRCRVGFQRQLWLPKAGENGLTGGQVNQGSSRRQGQLAMIYQRLIKCKCRKVIVKPKCKTTCPPGPITSQCDAGTRELVETITNFIPIGCRCVKQVYTRRTRVVCPEYTNFVSAHCSPETNLEKLVYLRAYQENCECKQKELVTYKKCGCPKPTQSEAVCNNQLNQLESIRTFHDLEDGVCLSRKQMIRKRVDCSHQGNTIQDSNQGQRRYELKCDPKTSRGQVLALEWQVDRCRCVRKPVVVREGICKCPKSRSVQVCDRQTNQWIKSLTSFELDRVELRCVSRTKNQREPISRLLTTDCVIDCPSASVNRHQCNHQTGWQLVETTTYQPRSCRCLPVKSRQLVDCSCSSSTIITKTSASDEKRCADGLLLEVSKRLVWNEAVGACIEGKFARRSQPACNSSYVSIRNGQCVDGKMHQKLTEFNYDKVTCKCRVKEFNQVVDCRCNSRRVSGGECGSKDDQIRPRILIDKIVDQRWNQEKARCEDVGERSELRRRRMCKCPAPSVKTQCVRGLIHETKILYHWDKQTFSCKAERITSKVQPKCHSKEGSVRLVPSSECNRETCLRQVDVLVERYNPNRCTCDWTVKERKQCSCCGCPKSSMQLACTTSPSTGLSVIEARITFYAAKQEQCGYKCVKQFHVRHKQLDCSRYPQPQRPHYGTCDPKSCRQPLISYFYEPRQCQCVLATRTVSWRQCCCPSNLVPLDNEKHCQSGQLVITRRKPAFKQGKCVFVPSIDRKNVECPSKVEKRAGECRKETCRRPIYELLHTVDRFTCKCKSVQRLVEEKDCCCLEKPRLREACVGQCKVVVKEAYQFDAGKERCVKESFVEQSCPTCPKPSKVKGQCIDCFQTIRHTSYVVENCACKPVDRIERVHCCCPQSSKREESRCDADRGVIQHKHVEYKLVNGKCAQRVRLIESPVACPSPIPSPSNQHTVGKCDPLTCLQPIVQSSHSDSLDWVRVGCRCVRRSEQAPGQLASVQSVHPTPGFRQCCCRPGEKANRVKELCQPNGQLLTITESWRLVDDGTCKPVKTRRVTSVKCPVEQVKPLSRCDPLTKNQRVLLIKSKLVACKCVEYFRSVIVKPCECPLTKAVGIECLPDTCLTSLVQMNWRRNPLTGSCQPIPGSEQRLFGMQQCCCRKGDQPSQPVGKSMRCRSGLTESVEQWFRFDRQSGECRRFERILDSKPIEDCTRLNKVKKGRCNAVTGKATDQLIEWHLDKTQCKCQRLVKAITRSCECAHLNKQVQPPICLNDEGVMIKKVVEYRLQESGSKCLPYVKWYKKEIVCPIVKSIKQVSPCNPDTCREVEEVTFYERRQCKCIQQRRLINKLCCCRGDVESSSHSRSCTTINGKAHLTAIQVRLELDLDKSRCIRHEEKIDKDVVCPTENSRMIGQFCDQSTCRVSQLWVKFVQHDCECKAMKRSQPKVPDEMCCCPKPRYAVRCYPKQGIQSRIAYRYELHRGSCITRKYVDQGRVTCPPPQVRRGECNKETGMRLTETHVFTRKDCRCGEAISRGQEPCACPAPKIVKRPCRVVNTTSQREVVRLTYDLARDGGKVKCNARERVIHSEPCNCPPSKSIHFCHKGSVVRIKRGFKLLDGGGGDQSGRVSCVERRLMESHPVKCSSTKIKTYAYPCVNNRRKIVVTKPSVDAKKCRCGLLAKSYVEACDCEKLSSVKKVCSNGAWIAVHEIHTTRPRIGQCLKVTKRTVHPVACPTTTRRLVNPDAPCTLVRPDGLYRSETTEWYELVDCKCLLRRSTQLKLCSCPVKPTAVKTCLDGHSSLAVYTTSYVKLGDKCLPSQDVVTSEVRCDHPAKIVSHSTCEKQPIANQLKHKGPQCVETIQIRNFKVDNCQCIATNRVVRRRCCVPEPIKQQKCNVKHGRWIDIVHRFALVDGKVLFKSGPLIVRDRQIKSMREEKVRQVICPKPETLEHCDRTTGILTKRYRQYRRDKCNCIRVEKVEKEKCPPILCPPPRVVSLSRECVNQSRLQAVQSYMAASDGTCKPDKPRLVKVPCGNCPPPTKRAYCDGHGRWVKCYTQYWPEEQEQRSSVSSPGLPHDCRLVKHCMRWKAECDEARVEVKGRVKLVSPNKQMTQLVKMGHLDPVSCQCRPQIVRQWIEFTSCDHLNHKQVICENNAVKTINYNHQLVKGDCVPKLVEHSRPIVCQKPIRKVSQCDRNPASPNRGLIIETIQDSTVVNCTCVALKKRLVKHPCDCSLIHPTTTRVHPIDKAKIQTRQLRWNLVKDRCVPRLIEATKLIKCDTKIKLRKGACIVPNEAKDGVARQTIERMQRQPVKGRCHWTAIGATQVICGCPKPRVVDECVDDGKRILRKHQSWQLSKFKCKLSERLQYVKPTCSAENVDISRQLLTDGPFKVGPCKHTSCQARRTEWIPAIKACKCVLVKKVSQSRCCCPKPITINRHCDSTLNQLIVNEKQFHPTRAAGNKLTCRPQHVNRIIPTDSCGSNGHRFVVGPCNIDGQFALVDVYMPRQRSGRKGSNCQCELELEKKVKIRCGCPSNIQYSVGTCVNDWAIEKWTVDEAVPNEGRPICRPTLLTTRPMRCACDTVKNTDSRVKRQCRQGRAITWSIVKFELNKQANSCERRVITRGQKVVCPPTKSRLMQCDPTGRHLVELVEKWKSVNCRCVKHTLRLEHRHRPCKCPEERRIQRACSSNQRLYDLVRWVVQPNGKCKPLISRGVEKLACPNDSKLKPVYGECNNPSNNQRSIQWLQPVMRNCKCEWRRLTGEEVAARKLPQSSACSCPPSFKAQSCQHQYRHQWVNGKSESVDIREQVSTWVRFLLVKGECKAVRKIERVKVDCSPKTMVKNSACDPVTNKYTQITTTVSQGDSCQCQQTSSKRQCDCSCPQTPRRLERCYARQQMLRVTSMTYAIDPENKCQCRGQTTIQTKRLSCPSSVKLIGQTECDKDAATLSIDVDKYRTRHFVKFKLDVCKCKPHRFFVRTPCFCAPKPKFEHQCRQNIELIEIESVRKLNADNSACVRVEVSRRAKPVELGKGKIVIKCNKQTGVETVTQSEPFIVNCNRRFRIKQYRRRCKCQSEPKLVQKTHCQVNSTCLEEVTWLRERLLPDKRKCQRQIRVEKRACCCHQRQPEQLPIKCDNFFGILRTGYREWHLEGHHCVPNDQWKSRVIKCIQPPDNRITRIRLPNGVLRISRRFVALVDCQCRQKISVGYQRWKCPKPAVTRHCVPGPTGSSQFKIEQVQTRWSISPHRPSCDRMQQVVDSKNVDCSTLTKRQTSTASCQLDSSRLAFIRVNLVERQQADGCKCRPMPEERRVKLCRCLATKLEQTCDKTITSYRPVVDGSRCLSRITRFSTRLSSLLALASTRLVSKSPCDAQTGLQTQFYREIALVNCRPAIRLKRVTVRCSCPKPTHTMRCSSKPGHREVITLAYVMTRGIGDLETKCNPVRRRQVERITCPLPPLKLTDGLKLASHLDHSTGCVVVKRATPCHSDGHCKQMVHELRPAFDASRCSWTWSRLLTRSSLRACCCPKPEVKVKCDADRGHLVKRQIETKLDAKSGRCIETVHENVEPIECPTKQEIRPVEPCINGKQKKAIMELVREGCECVSKKKILVEHCQPVKQSTTHVVFLVDASANSRIVNYESSLKRLMLQALDRLGEHPGHVTVSLIKYAGLKVGASLELANLALGPEGTKKAEGLIMQRINDLGLIGIDAKGRLAGALELVRDKILSKTRPGTKLIIYVISDGLDADREAAKALSRQLRQAGVLIKAINVSPPLKDGEDDDRGDRTFLRRVVSAMKTKNYAELDNRNQISRQLDDIGQTKKQVCPPNIIKQTLCSVKTNCVGRTFVDAFVFDKTKGYCVNRKRVDSVHCCCMQKPRSRVERQGDRLISIVENWQLTPANRCMMFAFKRDITQHLREACSPSTERRRGQCNAEGFAVEQITHRILVDFKCSVSRSQRRIVRCRCPDPTVKKQCVGDSSIVSRLIGNRLDEAGECLRVVKERQVKMVCPKSHQVKSGCDKMTCKQRIASVTFEPQQCRCLRRVKVDEVTCCCKRQKSTSYAGCKHNALKLFIERSVEERTSASGPCIQRIRHTLEPVDCPENPRVIRHECGKADADKSIGPNLTFRKVERLRHRLVNCVCQLERKLHFELCGCAKGDDGVVTSKCSQPHSGVQLTHQHQLKLQVDGIDVKNGSGLLVQSLSSAKCVEQDRLVKVHKIVCPDAKLEVSPCQHSPTDGRSYIWTRQHSWRRVGCKCVEHHPSQVIRRQLCACRPSTSTTQCRKDALTGLASMLEVTSTGEQLVKADDSGKKICQPVTRVTNHKVECPRSQVKHSVCSKQATRVTTIRLVSLQNCKCKLSIRKLATPCSPVKRDRASTTSKAPTKGFLGLTAKRPSKEAEPCLDFLPVGRCKQHASLQACDRPGQIRDLLCRRSCHQCQVESLREIDFHAPPLTSSDGHTNCLLSQHQPGPNLGTALRQLSHAKVTLALCKLACALRPQCLSFNYYVPIKQLSSYPNCVLNRIAPAGGAKFDLKEKMRLYKNELIQRRASRCLLFVKTGPKAKDCSRSNPVKVNALGNCNCQHKSLVWSEPRPSYMSNISQTSTKPYLICARRVRVQYAVASNKQCQPNSWIGLLPCKPVVKQHDNGDVEKELTGLGVCKDKWPSLLCGAKLGRAGPKVACATSLIQKNCAESCGRCHCDATKRLFSDCLPRINKRLEIGVEFKRHPDHGLCTMSIKRRLIACDSCPIGKFVTVGSCNPTNHKRLLTLVDTLRTGQSACQFKVSQKQASCAKCPWQSQQSISPCMVQPGSTSSGESFLSLITDVAVNVNGCCRIQRHKRLFRCQSCPKPRVDLGQCKLGRRLRYLIYFTRPGTNQTTSPSNCVKRWIVREEACSEDKKEIDYPTSSCKDQLPTVDCLVLKKKKGFCRQIANHNVQFCQRSCELC